ncbi:MAG: GTPase ObgE [Candidatus Omnitrophica bacterium]|nr:GTPase ObgE [Candidatus Omnitrophota bacterium]
MFIDEARIFVKAGDGGDGCNSLYRDRVNRFGTPDGGPGGNGGSIIFEADCNVHTLLDFQYRQHFKADPGSHGSSNHKKGLWGKDLHIKVPVGTIIRDAENGLLMRDLACAGDSVVIAKGGQGGRGNSRGREALKGARGEEKTVTLELKLIADVGIIGYPNSGKSTLISKISSARPKIASYPFTTKEPVLGMVRIHDDFSVLVADIPGLIEGAHEGRGLGHKFLRHVERTKVLLHLIDIAATDCRDPYKDYTTLNRELTKYSKELAKKPQIVVLNKIDCPQSEENLKAFRKKMKAKKFLKISALTGEGLKELVRAIGKKVK